jgi:WD40 repeat protein
MARTLQTIVAVALALLSAIGAAGAAADAGEEPLPLIDASGEVTEPVLETLLAPGEFPGRLFRLVVEGEAALFCLDSSLDSAEPFAEIDPARVRWPMAAGLKIAVLSGAVRLTPSASTVSDADLDRGFSVRLTLRPLGQVFDPAPHFQVAVTAAQVVADESGDVLLSWRAPAAPAICRTGQKPGQPSCDLTGIGREVRALAVSPDGARLAIALGGLRPRVEIYDVSAAPRLHWQSLFPTGTGGAVEVAFSADGEWVVALTGAGQIHRFDARTGGRHLAIPSSGRTARALPPGRVMAVAGEKGEVTLWILADGTIDWRLPPRDLRGPVDRIATSGDGSRFATLEYDKDRTVVRVWAVKRRAMLAQVEVGAYAVADIALDHRGRRLFISHEKKGLFAADVGAGGAAPEPVGGKAAARCRSKLQWIPGQNVLSCAVDGGVLKIDGNGKQLAELRTGVDASDWIVAAASGGRRFAAVGAGHLLIWRDEDR